MNKAAANDPEVIEVAMAMISSATKEEPEPVLGRALEMLDGARRLLEALSPEDIARAAARVRLGGERQDEIAAYWKVYAQRYRVLVDVFTRQHSSLLERVREVAKGGTS